MCQYSSTRVRKRQWCKPKHPLNCVTFGSVGSATDFNTKGHKFDPALGMSNVFFENVFKVTELFKLVYF